MSRPTSAFQPERYSIHVEDRVLEDLRERLLKTRWPQAAPGLLWDQGTDLVYLRALVDYWADEFDWRAQERWLNGFDNYRVRIEGIPIHFVHHRARTGHGIPLILTHGWPSTFVELLPLLALLTDPTAHGIDGPAFDVVVPSLPGYGLSARPDRAVRYQDVAELWRALMRGLGYSRYGAGGSDFGSGVSSYMALQDPEALIGLHRPGIASAVGRRAGLPGAGAAVGRDRVRVHSDPIDQAANPRLCTQRFARRTCSLGPREVAFLERQPGRPGRSFFSRLPAHDGDPLLGHGDDHLVNA